MTSVRIANPSNLNRRVRAAREQWIASQKKGKRKARAPLTVRRLLAVVIFALSVAIVLWVIR